MQKEQAALIQKKRAAFSGSWYPGNARQCKEDIEQFLKERKQQTTPFQGVFSAGIVPHAGWFFSGSIACRVIASIASSFSETLGRAEKTERIEKTGIEGKIGLEGARERKIDAVIIFGMHMHPESSPCTMVTGRWETPLGDINIHEPLAVELAETVSAATDIRQDSPMTFAEENTIELQLPFIKYFFPDSAIVPVGVPPGAVAERIGIASIECAEKLGLNVVVIGSTDMTHYGSNFGFSPAGSGQKALDWVRNDNDRMAIKAMIAMDSREVISQGLENRNMCCAGAVAATICAAKKMGAVKGIELDYATSYDKSPGSSFVGYSGILFAH